MFPTHSLYLNGLKHSEGGAGAFTGRVVKVCWHQWTTGANFPPPRIKISPTSPVLIEIPANFICATILFGLRCGIPGTRNKDGGERRW